MHDDKFRPADIGNQIGVIGDMGPALHGVNVHRRSNTAPHFNSNGILLLAKPFNRLVTLVRYHYFAESLNFVVGLRSLTAPREPSSGFQPKASGAKLGHSTEAA